MEARGTTPEREKNKKDRRKKEKKEEKKEKKKEKKARKDKQYEEALLEPFRDIFEGGEPPLMNHRPRLCERGPLRCETWRAHLLNYHLLLH